MSKLLDAITRHVLDMEAQARNAEDEAAVAIALTRTEAENSTIVEEALKAISDDPDCPGFVTAPKFIASLAALPVQQRERERQRLREIIHSNRKLASRVGWRSLNKQLNAAIMAVERVLEMESLSPDDAPRVVDPFDHLALARLFIGDSAYQGHSTIRRRTGVWYRWNGRNYVVVSGELMEAEAYGFLEPLIIETADGSRPFNPNKKAVELFLHALASLVQVEDTGPWIVWLDDAAPDRPDPTRCVYFSNCTLAVDWWLEGRADALIEPTPTLFNTASLAFPYDPNATCPGFKAFINEVFDGDEERISATQMLGGYWMTPDTRLQIVAILLGRPGSGKGTLARIILQTFGRQAVTPALADLGTHFGLEGLVGANLALIGDTHCAGEDSQRAAENILRISGEDPCDIHRKHKPPLVAQRLPVRISIQENEPVGLPDVSGALRRRLVVLTFRHSFIGKEDDTLSTRLIQDEGPGILLWFLEGLRLMDHIRKHAENSGEKAAALIKKALQPRDGLPELDRLSELGNLVVPFVEERCQLGEKLAVDSATLYMHFSQWLEENGYKKRTRQTLINHLEGAYPSVKEKQLGPEGARVRTVVGLTLNVIAKMSDASKQNGGSHGV